MYSTSELINLKKFIDSATNNDLQVSPERLAPKPMELSEKISLANQRLRNIFEGGQAAQNTTTDIVSEAWDMADEEEKLRNQSTFLLEFPHDTNPDQIVKAIREKASIFAHDWKSYWQSEHGNSKRESSFGNKNKDAAQIAEMAKRYYGNSSIGSEVVQLFMQTIDRLENNVIDKDQKRIVVGQIGGKNVAIRSNIFKTKSSLGAGIDFPIVAKIGDETISHDITIVFTKDKDNKYFDNNSGGTLQLMLNEAIVANKLKPNRAVQQ